MTGITDPSEEYFKDGAWGWDGTQWRKLPLIWGFSDTYGETETEVGVTADDHNLTFSAVPPGEVWVIQLLSAFCSTSNPTRVGMFANIGGDSRLLGRTAYATEYMTVGTMGAITLKEDDYLWVRFYGCGAGDTITANAVGYKMRVAE